MSLSRMTINLTKVLKAKQAESNLSIEALAKAVGVSTVSVRGVLRGKSKPNATTAKKYAAFLGIDIAELTSAKSAGKKSAGKSTSTSTAKKSAGKKPAGKLAKGKARRAGGNSEGLGSDLIRVAAAAADLLDDGLAVAVHLAGKVERDLIGRLLAIV